MPDWRSTFKGLELDDLMELDGEEFARRLFLATKETLEAEGMGGVEASRTALRICQQAVLRLLGYEQREVLHPLRIRKRTASRDAERAHQVIRDGAAHVARRRLPPVPLPDDARVVVDRPPASLRGRWRR